MSIAAVPAGRMFVERFLVDNDYSNSYEVWKRLGSPQKPTSDQYAALERAGQLHLADSPHWETAKSGQLQLAFALQRHGVTLILVTW